MPSADTFLTGTIPHKHSAVRYKYAGFDGERMQELEANMDRLMAQSYR